VAHTRGDFQSKRADPLTTTTNAAGTGISAAAIVVISLALVLADAVQRPIEGSGQPLRHTQSREFDFLGQNLRKYDGKPLVKPSKKNTHAFMEKVRGLIKANQTVNQAVLIRLLNPVIRGWANYHRHCAAKNTFNRLDHEIWRALWQWARRRHPKKSRDWVKKHYFPAQRNRAWMFAAQTGQLTSDGKPIWLRLVYAGETKIRRHVKIQPV
jgi:RNA-directed DNA polymerase